MSAYQDGIVGVLLLEQRRGVFVFTRIGTGIYQFLHLMAQTPDGKVFIIQGAEAKDQQIWVTTQDAQDAIRSMAVTDLREQKEGAMMSALAHATSRTQMLGTDSLPEEWWLPLAQKQIEQIGVAFGFICSGSHLLHIPKPWLEPAISDYVHGDFILKNGHLLALLVRTIDGQSLKQEFVLAVDERNRVFLVKRCELEGILSKDVVIDIYAQDGTQSTLRLPLAALPPEQRKFFPEFLNLACVRNLANTRFDHLPKRLFEPNPNFSA